MLERIRDRLTGDQGHVNGPVHIKRQVIRIPDELNVPLAPTLEMDEVLAKLAQVRGHLDRLHVALTMLVEDLVNTGQVIKALDRLLQRR